MSIIEDIMGNSAFVSIQPVSYSQMRENAPIYTLERRAGTMDFVKVEVSELIKKLKENRTKHEKEYKEAVVDYRKACKNKLELTLKKLKSPEAKIDTSKPSNDLQVYMQAPQCHLKDYDQIIMMLEMSTDTKVEVKERDFRCFVLDLWDWKQAFSASNTMYKSFSGLRANEFVLPANSALISSPLLEDDPEAIG